MQRDDRLRAQRQFWDAEAASFDEQPDHGLRDPAVRLAWASRLHAWLPPAPARVLDLGCGTGTLSVLLAELGYEVTGVDFSAAMIGAAQAKAADAGHSVEFHVQEASAPKLPRCGYRVVLCRHLLWTFRDPAAVLQRWTPLLAPGGRLALIEGRWSTGAGLRAAELVAYLPAAVEVVQVEQLATSPELWGGAVTDERYVVLADLRPEQP